MKLQLFYPPEKNLINTEMPEVLEEGAGLNPPLGLLYIASSVKRYTDWDVEVVDALAEKLDFSQIEARIRSYCPDIVGITVMTHQLIDCLEIAKIAKRINPKIRVVLGGPHVHIYPYETIAFNCVDFAVTGEGEETIVELLMLWDRPDRQHDVPGLCFKNSGSVVINQHREAANDLDNIAHPDRRLIKYQLYYSSIAKESIVSTMITSRGCPYRCIFCNRPSMGKKFRARSPKDVVDEMEECGQIGIKHIMLYDDTFTVDRVRVAAICDEIKKRGIVISWDIRARVNNVDEEILKALKSAGCALICYGVESGNDEILKRIRKDITTAQARVAFKLTKKAGIKTLAYFMIGNPGETKEQIFDTLRFSRELDPDYCHFAILIPFPATPLYEEGLVSGRYKSDYWCEYAKNPQSSFKPKLWIEHVPVQEMRELLVKAYKDFYIRPSYIVKKLVEICSIDEMKRKFKAGFHIMRV